jgi:hypothetical protein
MMNLQFEVNYKLIEFQGFFLVEIISTLREGFKLNCFQREKIYSLEFKEQ